MTKSEKITLFVVLAVAVLLIAWAIWAGVLARRVNLECIAAGYETSHHMFFTREGYCTKVIVNQQMLTVPLAYAIREEQ